MLIVAHIRALDPRSLLAAIVAAGAVAACGGNVVVDGAPSPGGPAGSGGATGGTTGSTTGGSGGSTASGVQIPGGGTTMCHEDYLSLVGELESALGCTPTANIVQCSGTALLHDPCGCMVVVNEVDVQDVNFANALWSACEADGCCGPSVTGGCAPCPPAPTTGYCDTFTSQCKAGRP